MPRKAETPKAPYIPKGWLKNFFDLIKRIKLQDINRKLTRSHNLTAPGNESKLVSALKFLNLADSDGVLDQEKVKRLKMEGVESQTMMASILRESYSELFDTIDIEVATAADLRNYFTGRYNYSKNQSQGATILFAFLCEKANIQVSEEISNLNKQKVRFDSSKIENKKEIKHIAAVKQVELDDFPGFITQTESSQKNLEQNYVVIVKGKDFSFTKTLQKKEDIDLLVETLKINCKFKESQS